jgi:hypothetical protein
MVKETDSDDIKQRRKCRCCNQAYDYIVPGSLATRFICQECGKIPEPVRRVLVIINKRLTEIEARLKTAQAGTTASKGSSE